MKIYQYQNNWPINMQFNNFNKLGWILSMKNDRLIRLNKAGTIKERNI